MYNTDSIITIKRTFYLDIAAAAVAAAAAAAAAAGRCQASISSIDQTCKNFSALKQESKTFRQHGR
jgi:hypothetical protein